MIQATRSSSEQRVQQPNQTETNQKTKGSFDYKNKIWKHIENTNGIVKKTIKVITIAKTGLAAKLKPIIEKLGILSFVSVALSLISLPGAFQDFITSIRRTCVDLEEVFFQLANLLLTPMGIISDLSTALESLSAFGLISNVTYFAFLGLPFAIIGLSYASFKGCYDIIQHSLILSSIRTPDEEALKTYLDKTIDGTKAEQKKFKHDVTLLKDKNVRKLTRHTDKKICSIMQMLQENLKNSNNDQTASNVKDLKTILARKITLTTIETLSKVVLVAAMVTALFFPLPALLIPIIALIGAGISTGRHIFTQHFMYTGINHK